MGIVNRFNTTQSSWYGVNIYTHAGDLVQEVPFLMIGGANTAVASQIHLSAWGDLFIILTDGSMMTAPCAAFS